MIGERLEEARKRKGVSIREVAEATKIRGDYLLAMEDNSFEIPLPDIYIRGFLKNYARFLQLDTSKVMTDYEAHVLGKANRPPVSASRADSQNSLGRVEIPEEEEENQEQQEPEEKIVITEPTEDEQDESELTFSFKKESKPKSAVPQVRTLKSETSVMDQDSWNENKALYMKIGLVFMAILLVAIILIVLIQMMGGKGASPEINPELATSQPVEETSAIEPEPIVQNSSSEIITITATDSLTIIVEQTVDRKRLYSGTLIAGETLSLEKEGPVSIRFSSGAAMRIEKDGQRYNIPQTGMGRTVIE